MGHHHGGADAVEGIIAILKLIGFLIYFAVWAVDKSVDAYNARLAKQRRVEDELMERLLGTDWGPTSTGRSADLAFFATHTICQRCGCFFDVTDATDTCSVAGWHTYTKVLHETVRRTVARRFSIPMATVPELQLPLTAAKKRHAQVRPVQELADDWVLVDETEDDDVADDDDVDDEKSAAAKTDDAAHEVHVVPGSGVLPVTPQEADRQHEKLTTSLPDGIDSLSEFDVERAPHPPSEEPSMATAPPLEEDDVANASTSSKAPPPSYFAVAQM